MLKGQNGRPATVDERPDSLNLFGAWKWASCSGGLTIARGHSEATPGCSLVVYIHRDGTYAQWERDSVGDNLLGFGKLTFRGHERGAMWVQFEGDFFWDGHDQLITLRGRDEFVCNPGGHNMFVSDAPACLYTRTTGDPEPELTAAAINERNQLRFAKIRHRGVFVRDQDMNQQLPSSAPAQVDTATIRERPLHR